MYVERADSEFGGGTTRKTITLFLPHIHSGKGTLVTNAARRIGSARARGMFAEFERILI